jgi:hypothetical protein
MPAGQRTWKTTEVAALRRLYKTQSTDDVCRELNRSQKSVYRKAAELGIAKKRSQDEKAL